MQVTRQLARRDSQLLAQTTAQPIVHGQCLGDVPLGGQRLRQQPVPTLPKRRILDERSARAQGRAQLDSTEADAGPGYAFVRTKPELAEIAPERFDPFRLFADEEPSARDVQSHPGGTPSFGPRLPVYRGFSPVDGGARRLEVDERVFREGELHHVAAAFDRENASQPREQRREAAVMAVWPQRTDELVACRGTSAIDDEVREKAAPLPPRQRRLDPHAAEIRDQAAAQLDPRLRQACANLSPTVQRYKIRHNRWRRSDDKGDQLRVRTGDPRRDR
jgi:hypothetical protein